MFPDLLDEEREGLDDAGDGAVLLEEVVEFLRLLQEDVLLLLDHSFQSLQDALVHTFYVFSSLVTGLLGEALGMFLLVVVQQLGEFRLLVLVESDIVGVSSGLERHELTAGVVFVLDVL